MLLVLLLEVVSHLLDFHVLLFAFGDLVAFFFVNVARRITTRIWLLILLAYQGCCSEHQVAISIRGIRNILATLLCIIPLLSSLFNRRELSRAWLETLPCQKLVQRVTDAVLLMDVFSFHAVSMRSSIFAQRSALR
jgi:hypothetical protein